MDVAEVAAPSDSAILTVAAYVLSESTATASYLGVTKAVDSKSSLITYFQSPPHNDKSVP